MVHEIQQEIVNQVAVGDNNHNVAPADMRGFIISRQKFGKVILASIQVILETKVGAIIGAQGDGGAEYTARQAIR